MTFDASSQTVTLGMGMTWDKVYEALEPMGVMVTGGRIPGIGGLLVLFLNRGDIRFWHSA